MNIRQLLPNCSVCVKGHIDSDSSLNHYLSIATHNNSVLNEPKYINFNFNTVDDNKYQDILIKSFGSNIEVHPNLGYQFGFLDLFRRGYILASQQSSEYGLFINADIVINNEFLDLEVPDDVDFAYIPNVCSLFFRDKTPDEWIQEGCPGLLAQGWLILKRLNNTPHFLSEDWSKMAAEWQGDSRQNGIVSEVNIWDAHKDLNEHGLMDDEMFREYCHFIQQNNICDGSAKNIYYQPLGVTHYHYPQFQVFPFALENK